MTGSATSESKSNEYIPQLEKMLDASLAHVPTLGWTDATLRAGAQSLGVSPSLATLAPGGPMDLVTHWMRRATLEMSRQMRTMPLRAMRPSEIIRTAIRVRLELQTPYLNNWHEAMAMGALPFNLPTTTNELFFMIDEMWALAGDTSTQMDWYTKRGTLLAVYAATEVYMLTDKSEGLS
eukprot:GABV01000972.1.p1 GENE.GABV01000972.1~~GABV01000972.1.p1  ORF type:complete len:179 (+),score=45.15 GABV01000972.1:433-969(+)